MIGGVNIMVDVAAGCCHIDIDADAKGGYHFLRRRPAPLFTL
jgi:hypothetical protein